MLDGLESSRYREPSAAADFRCRLVQISPRGGAMWYISPVEAI